jgi:subtilase family serine protease
LPSGEARPFDPAGGVAWIAARSSFDTPLTAAVWREAERRLEDRASRIDVWRRLAERIYNQPLQSRIANTTIVVIESH